MTANNLISFFTFLDTWTINSCNGSIWLGAYLYRCAISCIHCQKPSSWWALFCSVSFSYSPSSMSRLHIPTDHCTMPLDIIIPPRLKIFQPFVDFRFSENIISGLKMDISDFGLNGLGSDSDETGDVKRGKHPPLKCQPDEKCFQELI